ncbi:MAG: hypothetical protein V1929_09080 [bacterium]
MQDDILTHGKHLLQMFPRATERDPIKLCKKLHRLEAVGRRIACAYCNGETAEAKHEADVNALLAKVRALLGSKRPWFNGDPLGYALKVAVTRDEVLHRDWGDNGIIAPDFTPAVEFRKCVNGTQAGLDLIAKANSFR